ncbi:MAG TPA: SH3 domain-containing protein [Acidobacteriaceae bacterium]
MTNYRVTAKSLNVREAPKLTATVIGHLSLDDIVEGLSVSGDAYWYKIKSTGGLTGWRSHRGFGE